MNFHRAERLRRELPDSTLEVALFLAAGGDERIRIDPATGRNRYATTATPRPDEVFLSSSTASTVTPRAYQAAKTAWAALSADSAAEYRRIDSWFDDLRGRLVALFGFAGCGVVLAASGTEAEIVALAIAKNMLPGPLTNIVMAPAETGSGVLRAAAGTHFLESTPFGEDGRVGRPLDGWRDEDIAAVAVEIRNDHGDLRSTDDVDSEVRHQAQVALAAGRNVLLHRLETSKTGRSGLTPDAAAGIAACAPGRVVVVVDCCQLRCSRNRIRRYLERGFMVALTGSKFFGGPPFSGALLLPPAVLNRLDRLTFPAGLAEHSSRLDWPDDLRARARLQWANEANLGLGLRWVAALEEMERYYSLPRVLRHAALQHFHNEVRKRAEGVDNIFYVGADSDDGWDSILPFTMNHPDGASFFPAEAATIHARLRSIPTQSPFGRDDRIFHVGQPVAIGATTALRVCASAPMVSDIAERMAVGAGVEQAFAPCGDNIDALFDKWRRLLAETSAGR